MANWVVIVGHDNVTGWEQMKFTFRNEAKRLSMDTRGYYIFLDSGGHNLDYNLVLYRMVPKFRANNQFYMELFKDLGIKLGDEIVVYPHEYGDPNYCGSLTEDLTGLESDYNRDLKYELFVSLGGNFAWKFVEKVCNSIKCKDEEIAIEGKMHSWTKIQRALEKKSLSDVASLIRNLFLPLDIDMQALSIMYREVEEKRRNREDLLDYLLNTTDPEGMLQSRIRFENMCTEGFNLLSDIEGLKSIKDILDLLEGKRDFLKRLDEMRECVTTEISQNDLKGRIKDYLDSFFWNNVTIFHEWYNAVDTYLKELSMK